MLQQLGYPIKRYAKAGASYKLCAPHNILPPKSHLDAKSIMDELRRARVYHDSRFEISRLYLIEGWELGQDKAELERRNFATEPQGSIDHWKRWTRKNGIFKNLSTEKVQFIKAFKETLGSAERIWDCLIFAGDVLLDNDEIKRHYEWHCLGKKKPREGVKIPKRRSSIFIPLSSNLTYLSHPDTFKNFQRLLFYTRVHFETSFESGRWAPDERGLYARSAELRAGLTELSYLHNLVFDALKQFNAGEHDKGGPLTRTDCLFTP
ncbi:hypothetical protein BBP40_012407 [Aspergillus hancockii]|nr:hypothetical protein BBP40_012407 [Aspergillus hancockii]